MCHCLVWRLHSESSSLFLLWYSFIYEENMEATLQVFRVEYQLWCSNWLKLKGYRQPRPLYRVSHAADQSNQTPVQPPSHLSDNDQTHLGWDLRMGMLVARMMLTRIRTSSPWIPSAATFFLSLRTGFSGRRGSDSCTRILPSMLPSTWGGWSGSYLFTLHSSLAGKWGCHTWVT